MESSGFPVIIRLREGLTVRITALAFLIVGTVGAFAQPAFQPRTATELFNLRSRCAALGEKMLEETAVGSALTKSETTHFDARTNHCYVDYFVHDIENGRVARYQNRSLFDGQTGEILAFAKIEKGERVGMIFGRISDMRNDLGFSDANEYIDRMMKEDR
jgi:hypothetical protein